MCREMDMRFWLEKADAELSGWSDGASPVGHTYRRG
jgi:hypothetical protein